MSYSKKLQNPLWQKKRLEILQRDNFECTLCGSKDKELHVHHRWYQFGKEIWDYPDINFQTLCYECHEHIEMCIKSSTSDMQVMVRRTPIAQDDYDVFCRLLLHLSEEEGYKNYNPRKIVDAIDYIIDNNTIDIIIKNNWV